MYQDSSVKPQTPAEIKGLSKSQKYFFILLAGATCIGFAPIFAKLAVDTDKIGGAGISPAAVAFWRLALSSPIFFLLAKRASFKTQKRKNTKKSWLLFLPGLFFALDLSFWHLSFEYTSVANATLEANMATLIVAIFGFFVLKERLDARFLLGLIVSLAGLFLLLYEGFRIDKTTLIGDMLGIATAFCYAGYILSLKALTRYYKVAHIMFMTTLVGSGAIFLGLFIYYGHSGYGVLLPTNKDTWIWLVLLALLAQVFGQAFIAKGMSGLPVSFSAISLFWQPVMTAILGFLILDQNLSMLQIFCGFLILFGIFLAKKGIVK